MPPAIQLLLFDIDGTLISTGGAGVTAFARTAELVFGVARADAGLHFAGRTDSAILREFFQRQGIEPTPENFTRFLEVYPFCLDHILGQRAGGPAAALAGVVSWLNPASQLRDPPALGLLTGNIRLGAEIKLRHYELWDHFALGAFGDDHEDRCELARIALTRAQALLRRDITGASVLVIGDTPLDIACARAIGAQVLAVASGTYSLPELQEHKPTWAVASLAQVDPAPLCRAGSGRRTPSGAEV